MQPYIGDHSRSKHVDSQIGVGIQPSDGHNGFREILEVVSRGALGGAGSNDSITLSISAASVGGLSGGRDRDVGVQGQWS
jgi:hypothetical protein